MTDSSGDSDCFESADEGFSDDNTVTSDQTKSKSGKKVPGQSETSSHTSSGVSSANNLKESRETSPTSNSLQYRKRPERGKSASKPVQAVLANSRKISLNEQIFKTDIIKPDALIQDITSNLSKNLNKGFSTIQQTSSSIKDLVISSLPVANFRESSSKFSYDDEEEEISSQVFQSNDDSNVAKDENDEPVKELTENVNKETVIAGKVHSSDIKEMEKDVEEKTLNSDLCNEMQKMEVSQSLDSNKTEDELENEEQINNSCNVITTEGSGDCTGQEPENFDEFNIAEDISHKAHLKEDLVEGTSNNENIEPEKPLEVDEKESANELEFETMEEEKNVVTDNVKDGWDSSGFELEGLDNIEESSPEASTDVIEYEVKEECKPEEEKIQKQDKEISDDIEGWDDFDIDDEELEVVKNENKPALNENTVKKSNQFAKPETNKSSLNQELIKSNGDENKNFGNDMKWTGWDNFGEKQESKPTSGWKFGSWGVNALLNTATSVTQGLTNVIESGLGVPDPETLARMELEADIDNNVSEKPKQENIQSNVGQQKENSPTNKAEDNISSGLNLFPNFGITNLVAGVTKNLVENTKVHEIGTKVIAGGLDTLESFGKKTMEVLQEGDPGLKKKRALLLGSDKPILSQVLREAKSKAEIEDKRMEEKQMARLCHFETLFDDFQGLIHLEALEMLSTQCELKLEQIKASLPTSEVEDLIGILDEVKELCTIDEDEFKANYSTMVDFKISLMKATEPLKNEISIKKIVQVYDEFDTWLKNDENTKKSARSLLQKAMSTLAELTAATVAQFHKGGELLSIKEHRKTVEEADVLLQMTGFLCCEISTISEKFLKLHSCCLSGNDEEIAFKIKEEANNAISYIKDAFNLLIPVLQLGAAT